MAEGIQISRKQMFALLGSVLVMSFLGILAGSYFVELKTAKARKISDILLKNGDVFPEFVFESLENLLVNSEQLLARKKTVLLFFTSDCGHCVKTIERWDSVYSSVNAKYQVIGVSFEPLDRIRHYKSSNSVEIPFYRDTNGKFTGQYKILRYPTLIGVDEKGRIAFIETGSQLERRVEDYLKLL